MTTELTATRDASGTWTFAAADAAMVAAAIPVKPPRSWFEKGPKTRLTITDEGRVYGMLADRTIPHIGMPGQPIYAPYSKSNYHWYHSGQTVCDDGSVIATGRITLNGTHPATDDSVTADAAVEHYERTSLAIADVVAWDEPEGVFCAGAARPGVTPEQIREATGSIPSGDWRIIDGQQEMVASLLVNTPGFPPRIGLAASGQITALVAAGSPQPLAFVKTNPAEEATMSGGTTTATLTKGDYVELVPTGAIGQVVESGEQLVLELPVGADDVRPATEEQAITAAAQRTERQRMASLESRIEQLTASLEARDRADEARRLLADVEV